MVQSNYEIVEAEPAKDLRERGDQFRLNGHRRRADRVNVALVELAESTAGRAVRTPDRLDLVTLEEFGELILVVSNDAGERDREVVA